MEERKTKIQKLFTFYDTNNNGVLEKKEFVAGFQDLISSIDRSLSLEDIKRIADEGIKQFDLNNNGLIEINEFTSLMEFLINEKGLNL